MMNASKLGISQLPGWRWAAKSLFQERLSNTAWVTDQFPYIIYYNSISVEYGWGCSWPDVHTMNTSKLGISQLPGWRVACKNLFQERSSNTDWATEQFDSPVYHSRSCVVNQLNINEDAPRRMFERWTPPCLVPVNFLGGEELKKVCFKSVRRTQPELQTSFDI